MMPLGRHGLGGVVRCTFEVLRVSRVVADAERVQLTTTG
jgi:hypothetical protein